jgi:hypothetical protein
LIHPTYAISTIQQTHYWTPLESNYQYQKIRSEVVQQQQVVVLIPNQYVRLCPVDSEPIARGREPAAWWSKATNFLNLGLLHGGLEFLDRARLQGEDCGQTTGAQACEAISVGIDLGRRRVPARQGLDSI